MLDFSSLTNLLNISLPIRSIKIVLTILVSLGIAFSSYKVTSWYYDKEIIKLENTVSQYDSAYKQLSELSNKQNQSILDLNKAKEDKSKAIIIAQEKAKQLAIENNKHAQDILRLQLENKDACQAANALVDDILSKERNNAKN